MTRKAEMVARLIVAVIDRETRTLNAHDYLAVIQEIRDDCADRLAAPDAEGSLQRQHPDVVKITRKWGRWQHQVDYRPFKQNRLIRRASVPPP